MFRAIRPFRSSLWLCSQAVNVLGLGVVNRVEDNYDYVFKAVLVGDYGVGKANLLSRFSRNEFVTTGQDRWGLELQTSIGLDGSLAVAPSERFSTELMSTQMRRLQ